MPSKWNQITPEGATVLARFVEAFETNKADRTRVGPKAFGSSMPAYVHDDKEWWAILVDDAVNNDGKLWERFKAERRRVVDKQVKLTRERIARAEECEAWWRLIEDDEDREMVFLFVVSEATRKPFSWFMTRRNKRNHAKKAWVKDFCRRRINQALHLVYEKARRMGLMRQDEPDLQVRQIITKPHTRSSHSAIRGWADEKWMPVRKAEDEPASQN